jgi:hypothetical protein
VKARAEKRMLAEIKAGMNPPSKEEGVVPTKIHSKERNR